MRETPQTITQKITRNSVRTDDPRHCSHLETHKDPLFKTFDGEEVGWPSEKAKRAHHKAVMIKWPEEKWSEKEPHMPMPRYPLKSLISDVPKKTRNPK
jgi:hypothetical protein